MDCWELVGDIQEDLIDIFYENRVSDRKRTICLILLFMNSELSQIYSEVKQLHV